MTLFERWFGTKNSPEDSSIVRMLVKELVEARRDAVKLAETQSATLDRIITSRYDRPERVSNPPREDRSPMAAQASLDDDAVWLKTAGIISDPEQ